MAEIEGIWEQGAIPVLAMETHGAETFYNLRLGTVAVVVVEEGFRG